MKSFLAVSALTLLAACNSDQGTSLDAAGVEPALARIDSNSRAHLVWADSVLVDGVFVPAGIRGDGRLRNGVTSTGTPSNEYQGEYCGVSAKLATTSGATGELNFDPDASYSSTMQSGCGGPRSYSFYLAGSGGAATISSPHSIARGIALLAPGATSVQWEGFGIQLSGCQNVMFDSQYPPASSPRQTRLADTVTANGTVRHWRIASEGSHRAVCLVAGNGGKLVSTGVSYFLPFSLTITEVKYPFPSYP